MVYDGELEGNRMRGGTGGDYYVIDHRNASSFRFRNENPLALSVDVLSPFQVSIRPVLASLLSLDLARDLFRQ